MSEHENTAVRAVPAIVLAGDRRAAKAVYGESKVYLQIAERPLVGHVVGVLQKVPEVSEVWVVGNAERLEAALGAEPFRRTLTKPLHVIPQFRNLYENGWETYRRLLPGAPPEGRDPGPEDGDLAVLYLSGDLPFATAEEIGAFVRASLERGLDYTVGLVTEESMLPFQGETGRPGIEMACFNLREGRYRQSNMNLIKPARVVNRFYVEEMYEHRYQKQFGNIVGLAWRLLRTEKGGLRIVAYYLLMHAAAFADRRGWRRTADRLRSKIPMSKVEAAISELFRTSFGFVTTEAGGCAIDIDNESDFDAATARYEEWRREQAERAAKLYGSLPEQATPHD